MDSKTIINPAKFSWDRTLAFFSQTILGLTTVAATFLLYGANGINLTDEGFGLAHAKRILSGEIPHRDFVHIKFTGSGLLHAAYLGFFPDQWILVSRLVALLQLYGACILWILCLRRYLFKGTGTLRIWWASTIAFLLSLHDFPIMAWYTIDGITFCSLGIFCFFRKKAILGIFLAGCAILFKQSFFMVPLFLLTLCFADPYRATPQKIWAAFCAIVPCLLYFLWIGISGGAEEFVRQVFFASGQVSTSEIWVGFFFRPGQWFLLGAGTGIFLKILNLKGKPSILISAKMISLILLVVALFWAMYHPAEMHRAMISASLFCLGFVLVATLFLWKSNQELSRLVGAALVLAYSVNISVGYNNFLLMLGPLMFSALAVFFSYDEREESVDADLKSRRPFKWAALASLPVYLMAFHNWRSHCIYRDLPAAKLQEPLSGVLPGARGVFTSSGNFQMIRDLVTLLSKYPNRPVAVLPAFAAVWPGSTRCNPLTSDWPQETELPNEQTWEKVHLSLEKMRKEGGVVIFSKYYVEEISFVKKKLSLESQPTRGGYSRILKYFSVLAPTYESEFFRIYVFE